MFCCYTIAAVDWLETDYSREARDEEGGMQVLSKSGSVVKVRLLDREYRGHICFAY